MSYVLELFSPPTDPSLLTYGVYDPALVALSLLVASFASWMGLTMAGQANAQRGLRALVLASGSVALGSGVWAMHFIGMLAFSLCTRVDYAPLVTLASMLPSVAASYVALLLISRQELTGRLLALGGAVVGAGIGAMHYTGMAGMQMSLALRYDPWMFLLSILVAVALATLALWVKFGLSNVGRLKPAQRTLAAALVMGLAITGMHYTGMAAARFVGRVDPAQAGGSNSALLALAVALVTLAITALVAAVNGLARYRKLFRHLNQSEAWMRALLTTTVDGVVTLHADGSIAELNPAAERLFGWSRDELLGKDIGLLMAPPGDPEQDDLQRCLRSGGREVPAAGSDVMGRRRDGTLVPIRRALGHARLADQELFVCFITDISERRAMVQALAESEQQFRSLIRNIPGISYRRRMTGENQMVYISDAVERVAGYPAADFLGTPLKRAFRSMIHPGDRARVANAVEQAILRERTYLVEYRLLHADGSTRWLWEHGTGVRNEAGEVVWLDGVILDISERHQMEEALRHAKEKAEQAADARATFLANMSHEIRTPMNSILGFTDVLLDGDLSPEQRRHLDTVRNAGRSLLRLLNEVLDTAKLDRGAVELEVTDFNLLSLIDELSSTLGTNARAKGLQVDIRYDPRLPACVRGDELRIRQVLTNLLDNAIKFTASGSVSLLAEPEGGQIHFQVKDTGIGIAKGRLAAIFEPFTQADASMTRRYGGTGLGTTISKQLVELMGGQLNAESVPGKGTTFHIRLALVPAQYAPQERRQRAACALPPLKVLAADDVPQNLELLNLLLTRRGHRMVAATDGAQALELATREDFDIILMDMQMPHMDGLAATRAIRAQAQAAGRRRVPVVAMTASVLDAHRRASASAGMDGFASKPVDWMTLSHEIARVLGIASDDQATPAPAAPAQVLNRQAALARWGGSAAALQEALRLFERDYDDGAGQLSSRLKAGDRQGAAALAHRMRGVAANIGLEQLADALSTLERACGEADAAAPTVAPVAAALDAACAAIAALHAEASAEAAPAAAAAGPAAAIDRARLREGGAQLVQALRRGAIDDAGQRALLAALGTHPAARLVRDALADFDFERAIGHIEAAMAALAPFTDQENAP